jgi:regulator of sigma E protease
MTILLWILLTFLVFLIVVLIHELGHFSTARWTGMKVEEFGFGIPPRVATLFRDKKGTDYTFNLLPIGGFVRILGEDPTGEDAEKKWAFMTKSLPARLLVLVAWVSMNFLLAFVIFTGLFWTGTSPITVSPFSDAPTNSFFLPSFEEAEAMGYLTHSGIILSPLTGSIAEQAGILSGDILIQVNDIAPETTEQVVKVIQSNEQVNLLLNRSGSIVNIILTPQDGKVGTYIGYDNLALKKDFVYQKTGLDALVMWAKETYYSSVLTLDFLGKVLKNLIAPATPLEREEAKEMLSGPIGAGSLFVGLVEISAPISLIFLIIALLSINLWVVNLMPFPALDGGRMVTTILYSIFSFFPRSSGRFIVVEKYIHAIGFILLLGLMLYVAGLDIGRFF